jgi:hypothetical protein
VESATIGESARLQAQASRTTMIAGRRIMPPSIASYVLWIVSGSLSRIVIRPPLGTQPS